MFEKFVEVLTELGGKATNKAMLSKLEWTKEEYLNVRSGLVQDGVVKVAKGRGGSVVLVKKEENA